MFSMLIAAASLPSCPVEQARYALRTAPDITASFKDVDTPIAADGMDDWPSHLAFRIHMAKTGRTYWFLPWPGGTDDLQHLASTTDVTAPNWKPPNPSDGPRPLGDLDYIATDARYNVIDDIPHRGGMAPAHILLPRLGDSLWHQSPIVEPRDGAPKQFFDLVACGSRPTVGAGSMTTLGPAPPRSAVANSRFRRGR
jgi:hypothetical protein